MSNKIKNPTESHYFTWEHDVHKGYLYSCRECTYNVNNKCERRSEMASIELPLGDEPICGMGKKK